MQLQHMQIRNGALLLIKEDFWDTLLFLYQNALAKKKNIERFKTHAAARFPAIPHLYTGRGQEEEYSTGLEF